MTNRNNRRAFTLIELLVVIVIIGILVAIALPNYIRVKDRAREAEVKNNTHSIQLSLERYATDTESSNYPDYLLGGDWTDTYTVSDGFVNKQFGSISAAENELRSCCRGKAQSGDWAVIQTDPNERGDHGWTGDMLIVDGYLGDYPQNPFIRQTAEAGNRGLTWFPDGESGTYRMVGGRNGSMMVDVAGPVPTPGGTALVPRVPGNQFSGDLFIYPPFAPASSSGEDGGYGPTRDPLQDGVQYDCESGGGDAASNLEKGNNRIIGNFYYYPTTGDEGYSISLPNPHGPRGYHLVGYGAAFNLGNDFYDRVGEYPLQQRTFNWQNQFAINSADRSQVWSGMSVLDSADALPPDQGENTVCAPVHGGPDGRKDGAVVIHSSGVDVKANDAVTG